MLVGWLLGWIGEPLVWGSLVFGHKGSHFCGSNASARYWGLPHHTTLPHHVLWLDNVSGTSRNMVWRTHFTCNDFSAHQCIQHHPANLGWRIQAMYTTICCLIWNMMFEYHHHVLSVYSGIAFYTACLFCWEVSQRLLPETNPSGPLFQLETLSTKKNIAFFHPMQWTK